MRCHLSVVVILLSVALVTSTSPRRTPPRRTPPRQTTSPRQTPHTKTRQPLHDSETSSSASQLICLRRRNGIYPDGKDCTKFYECSNGIALSFSCPDGLLFDIKTRQCEWPEEATCGTPMEVKTRTPAPVLAGKTFRSAKCTSWTKWFDRDDPGKTGDYEGLKALREENPGKICDVPTAIEARVIATGQEASLTGEEFRFYDTINGFVCKLEDQNDGTCLDYEVRFCCPDVDCPDGYHPFLGICYKAFNIAASYQQSIILCKNDGGTLAMPRDKNTNDFLKALKDTVDPDSPFRFGLTDIREESVWEWADGKKMGDFTDWAPGEPNDLSDGPGEDCAEFYPDKNSMWNDKECNAHRKFICEVTECPEGYRLFQGICYRAFNFKANYHESIIWCEDDGGTLAMPRDKNTNEFLKALKDTVDPDSPFRFGLTDIQEESVWEWADGKKLGDFTDWAPGEPNDLSDGPGEDCAEFHQDKNKWNDWACRDYKKFICQVAGASLTAKTRTSPSLPGKEMYRSVGDFFCRRKENGNYANPKDCSKFFTCSNGISSHMSCPEGLYYNEETDQCDYPENVDCGPHFDSLGVTQCEYGGVYNHKTGECVCPQICPYNLDPVCGSDGEEYPNKCYLKIAECESQQDIHIIGRPPCPPLDPRTKQKPHGGFRQPLPVRATTPSSGTYIKGKARTPAKKMTRSVRETCNGKPDGSFADPEDCHSYYVCHDGHLYHYSCGEMYYDPNTGSCIFNEVPNCAQFTCDGKPNGNYADPKDCSKYYSCSNGNAIQITCPEGLYYNEKLGVCDYPENVDCV
ncbi:uncharacterized protein LOC144911022 isoform X2 [Branchiostoma floridae x Branchiostoma belcheri]